MDRTAFRKVLLEPLGRDLRLQLHKNTYQSCNQKGYVMAYVADVHMRELEGRLALLLHLLHLFLLVGPLLGFIHFLELVCAVCSAHAPLLLLLDPLLALDMNT